MEKGKVKDDGKGKYRRKPYTPRTIIQSDTSKLLLKNLRKLKRLCERILENDENKHLPSYEMIKQTFEKYSILLDVGSKGANLELIGQNLLPPLTIENPEKENPHVLRHEHIFDDFERLLLSPQWPTVLEKHHERRKAYYKKEKGLDSAWKRLFSYLQPLDDNQYYSDLTISMYARDLNHEIINKKEEIASLIQTYLKFIAAELSVSSYQKYDTKCYLRTDLKLSQRKHLDTNNKVVSLVNELKRIGYSDTNKPTPQRPNFFASPILTISKLQTPLYSDSGTPTRPRTALKINIINRLFS